MHEQGCTEKCRVKTLSLEIDLQRNKALVDTLIKIDWCTLCNSGTGNQQKGKSPASGAVKGLVCKYGCGMRFVQQCKPLMELYQKSEDRIKQLEEKFKLLDERDISFKKYRDQKEELKNAELKLKY